MADHIVLSREIFVGMAYVEIAVSGHDQGLANMLLVRPMLPSKQTWMALCSSGLQFTIHSYNRALARLHVRGTKDVFQCATYTTTPATREAVEVYALLWAAGLMYGPSFRTVCRAWAGTGVSCGLISVACGYHVHPAAADGILHLTCLGPACDRSMGSAMTQVPASFGEVRLVGVLALPSCWAALHTTSCTASESRVHCMVRYCFQISNLQSDFDYLIYFWLLPL